VIIPFLEEREKGKRYDEASKMWFTSAAFNAADIMEAQEDWRGVVNILGRVVNAGVPAGGVAAERMRAIRSEHWWLF